MSYTPTNWSAGDTVTSAKLNKMEQGIANAGGANILVAHYTMNGGSSTAPGGVRALSSNSVLSLDVTLRQIMDADFTIVQNNDSEAIGYDFIESISFYEDYSMIYLNKGPSLIAQSENDYPTIDTGSDSGDGDDNIYT